MQLGDEKSRSLPGGAPAAGGLAGGADSAEGVALPAALFFPAGKTKGSAKIKNKKAKYLLSGMVGALLPFLLREQKAGKN